VKNEAKRKIRKRNKAKRKSTEAKRILSASFQFEAKPAHPYLMCAGEFLEEAVPKLLSSFDICISIC
jgi:hypothetical protein